MGDVKLPMDVAEAQSEEAIEIAIAGGALKRCLHHPEVVIDLFNDATDSFKLAAARFRDGKLRSGFKSDRQVTDEIQAAIRRAGERCPICERMGRD